MIVEICHDPEEIKRLIKPVWDIAVADGDLFENFEPRMDYGQRWLIVRDSDNIEGIVFIEVTARQTIKFHPYLLGNWGGGRKMIKAVLKWFLGTNVHKLNISVPEIYTGTYNAAKKIGFIDEGIDRESFLKGGKYLDQRLLGLTRTEIEALL